MIGFSLLPSLLLLASTAVPVLSGPTPHHPIRHARRADTGTRYLVTFKKPQGITQDLAAGSISTQAITDKWSARISLAGQGSSYEPWQNIGGFSAVLDDNTLADLQDSDDIEAVEEDAPVHALQVGTVTNARWGLQRISQEEPLENPDAGRFTNTFTFLHNGTSGTGVDIYLLDTGVRATHSDFGGRATSAPPVPPGIYGSEDGNGHGTHVASTAAGTWAGIAKGANVIGVKVLDDDGSGQTSIILNGLDFVISEAQRTGRPSIINMSLGSDFVVQALDRGVENAIAAGIHVVVAAGNTRNGDASNFSPARVPDAITVGASTIKDTMAAFSSVGSAVDVIAPGVEIQAAFIGSDTASASLNGTSMAAPHAAGVVAALISLEGNRTPAEMGRRIVELAAENVLTGVPAGTPNRLLQLPRVA